MIQPTIRKRGRRGSPESWSVDSHVGQRVRIRRTILGMSQEKLGEAIGLTFQQVQKYERGANRISAGTLYRLSQVLNIPVSYFFDDYSDGQDSGQKSGNTAATAADSMSLTRREARLLRLWRDAPTQVSGEILSLLSSISPDWSDESDSEGTVGNTINGSDNTPLPATAPVDEQVSADHETVESRLALKHSKPHQKQKNRRRRPGAVWDPSDIYRGGKSEEPR